MDNEDQNPSMIALVFDVETTGLPLRQCNGRTGAPDPAVRANYAGARITQLAWQLVQTVTGQVLAQGSEYIRPSGADWAMHPMAEATHGISQAHLEKNGKDATEVLLNFLEAAICADVLVCHNVQFDLNVVLSELIHHLIEPVVSAPRYLLAKPNFCTMAASVNMCRLPFPNGRGWGPQAFKWPKLVELHQFLFSCTFDGAHDALEDVRATVRCFMELAKRGLVICAVRECAAHATGAGLKGDTGPAGVTEAGTEGKQGPTGLTGLTVQPEHQEPEFQI